MPGKNTWVWIFFIAAAIVSAKILDFAFADIFSLV